MKNKSIFVTQPSLAPLNEFTELLKGVWERGILTHNGPLVQELENRLKEKLNIKNYVAVSNGTIALQMSIKALNLKGDIIISPFTWIATLSSIHWEGCRAVFCDIDPDTFNIDVNKIEEKITDRTVAIMPVHVFGNPCNVEEIEKIAEKYNLKVIYDAAHAMGSTFKGKSLLRYGDISATSMHATKLFNTGEGGGCITESKVLNEKLKSIRFFGHDESKEIIMDGFNGKLTEVHAALGLSNLKYYDEVLSKRKENYLYYKKILNNKSMKFQQLRYGETNYSYFPVVFKSEKILLKVLDHLSFLKIFPRRYFYPSINKFSNVIEYVEMPISENIAKRILCLPLYNSIKKSEIKYISDQINKIA